jgi:hypothetical protein
MGIGYCLYLFYDWYNGVGGKGIDKMMKKLEVDVISAS